MAKRRRHRASAIGRDAKPRISKHDAYWQLEYSGNASRHESQREALLCLLNLKQQEELKSMKLEISRVQQCADQQIARMQGLLDAQKGLTTHYQSKANNLQRCIDAGAREQRYQWATLQGALNKLNGVT